MTDSAIFNHQNNHNMYKYIPYKLLKRQRRARIQNKYIYSKVPADSEEPKFPTAIWEKEQTSIFKSENLLQLIMES